MQQIYNWMFWFLLVIACIIFVVLFFIDAPYGRFYRNGWGRALSGRVAWILMEAPAALTILVMALLSPRLTALPALVFLLIWESHYFYRAFIFPFRGSGKRRPVPITIVCMGAIFNIWNGFLNGPDFFI